MDKDRDYQNMLENFAFDTSFGELALDQIKEEEWEDIHDMAKSLVRSKKIKKFHQAVIAAFLIWISDKEIMEAPRLTTDPVH